VVEGEEGVEDIGGVDVHVALGQVAVRHEVLVGEHDALGRAHGAAREEDGGEVLRGGGDEGRKALLGRRGQVVDVAALALGEGVDGLERLPHGPAELLALLLVDEENLGVAGPEEVRYLGDGELVVDRDDDGAGLEDGEVGHGPLGRVLAGHRDLGALAHA
jgi:hypothetical protein